MANRIQVRRTSTNDQPPANGSLLPGELAVEMGTPTRMWVGVPTSIEASGRKQLLDTAEGGNYAKLIGRNDFVGEQMVNGNVEIQLSDPRLILHSPGIVRGAWWVQNDGTVNWCGDASDYSTSVIKIGNSNGEFYAKGNVVAYWSDRRLKEEIAPLGGFEARIMALRPVSFQWNEKGQGLTGKAKGQREVGFIAQEALAISDQYVAENKTAEAAEGEDPYLTVRKDEMIADLVAMVQALTLRVRELEAKIGA